MPEPKYKPPKPYYGSTGNDSSKCRTCGGSGGGTDELSCPACSGRGSRRRDNTGNDDPHNW